MADQTSKDAAAKARILKHMNADHQRELSHYLRHYAKLSASAARNPKLEDLDFHTMTISTPSSGTHKIPISPPMTSWADARTRAVTMDVTSRAALGISDIRIDTFVPPNAIQLGVMIACTYTILSFIAQSAGYIAPGTTPWAVIDRFFPGGAETYCWIQKVIAVPVFLAHLSEAIYMARRCETHGVERMSGLWWKWVGDNFLEGFGAHMRFSALIKKKTAEKEGKKH